LPNPPGWAITIAVAAAISAIRNKNKMGPINLRTSYLFPGFSGVFSFFKLAQPTFNIIFLFTVRTPGESRLFHSLKADFEISLNALVGCMESYVPLT
jgi:hypothetical protein